MCYNIQKNDKGVKNSWFFWGFPLTTREIFYYIIGGDCCHVLGESWGWQ